VESRLAQKGSIARLGQLSATLGMPFLTDVLLRLFASFSILFSETWFEGICLGLLTQASFYRTILGRPSHVTAQ